MMVNLLLFSPLLRAQLLCVHFVHSCWTLQRRSLMCNYSTHANASLSRLSTKKEKKEIIFCSALCVSSSVILNFKKPLRRSPSLSLLVLLWSGTLWLWTMVCFLTKLETFFSVFQNSLNRISSLSPHHIYSLIRLIVCWVINKTNDKVENFLLNRSDYDHYQSPRCSRHNEQLSHSAKNRGDRVFTFFHTRWASAACFVI